jgi:uncharacterized protein DUF4386
MNTLKESSQGARRKTAIVVGVLYIIGTIAGVLSLVFAGPVLEDPEYLTKVSANENQIIIGALFLLTMGIALAMIPAVMFSLLKKHHEGLAVGYVVFRGALETVSYIAMAISWLLLLTISQEYVRAEASDAPYFQTLGALVLGGHDSIQSVLEIVFPLGALMFYTALYRSRLIPRWLSGWGLAAAIIWLVVGLLGMFHLITPMSTTQMLLSLPIGLQEMVMAVWLMVKGFNVSPTIGKIAPVQVAMSQA